ncbi:TetR/AcrR family transcriptional regulator [Fulvivirga sp. RKSG066]|nr:TetR/AcrR family transcriptional regulator [Fulvivirga aurantia]
MNARLFLRDPQETELGRKIVRESIKMIDRLGIEEFTFKKLAKEIESTEASIYRYFENKHKLLIYLISWYWNWLEYRIDFSTHNLADPEEKLKIAIGIVAGKKTSDNLFPDIDEIALNRIVIAESDKTYHTKQVDEDNSEGLFRGFKALCKKIAGFVKEIDSSYEYPHALVSTMLEAAHQQIFFAQHLPSLTELKKSREDTYDQNVKFLTHMVIGVLNNNSKAHA